MPPPRVHFYYTNFPLMFGSTIFGGTTVRKWSCDKEVELIAKLGQVERRLATECWWNGQSGS